jgi:hypothetical protein
VEIMHRNKSVVELLNYSTCQLCCIDGRVKGIGVINSSHNFLFETHGMCSLGDNRLKHWPFIQLEDLFVSKQCVFSFDPQFDYWNDLKKNGLPKSEDRF